MSRDLRPATLAEAVKDSFSRTEDERLREILLSLTEHVHAFARDIELTFEEWKQAVDFLTATGQKCTDVRQEFILLSDVLGLSMLVETMNDAHMPEATESTVLGPFHVVGSPRRELGENTSPHSDGPICVVHGTVRDDRGNIVPGATLDVWQANPNGFYDVQQPGEQPQGNGRGRYTADADGGFWFTTVVPAHYPIPTDGPVGSLLEATGRHAYRPAHIHFIVDAPGHRELTTHIFVEGSEYIDSDAVFAVKDGLIRRFDTRPAGTPNAYGIEGGFVEAQIDFVLHTGESQAKADVRIQGGAA